MLATPVINKNEIKDKLGISYGIANRLVKELVKADILVNRDNSIRNQYYKLNGYLELFK